MSKLPSFQFYPGDWQKEPTLRRCSKAAKGVYVDLLCLMFECPERGVLANGSVWSDKEISEAIGGEPSENLRCVVELLDKGVISRTSSGAVYSRRMVREENERRANAGRQAKHREKKERNEESNENVTPFIEDEGEREAEELRIRVGQLFNRRPETKWSDKEIAAFRKLLPIDLTELAKVEAYTLRERAKGKDGIHRRDLYTFLNNYRGEVDRANVPVAARAQHRSAI